MGCFQYHQLRAIRPAQRAKQSLRRGPIVRCLQPAAGRSQANAVGAAVQLLRGSRTTKHAEEQRELRFLVGVTLIVLYLSPGLRAQLPEPDGGAIERGSLPARWMSEQPKCMEIPEWQVHEYNPNLYILRQSPCTDFEKPFLYLFFGKEKALLMDTGSRHGNLVPTLRLTVRNWLVRN